MILIFLAPGFEEIEAITPIDLLKRAGKTVVSVAVSDNNVVCGAHRISLFCDIRQDEVSPYLDGNLEMIILPGGMPGTQNLEQSPTVTRAIAFAAENNIFISAICAAPSILGRLNLLRGKKAVCFPGCENALIGRTITTKNTVKDGNIITAKSAGYAMEFALMLITVLCGEKKADEIKKSIFCQ